MKRAKLYFPVFILFIFLVLYFFPACTGAPQKPSQVVIAFMKAVEQGNFEKAQSMLSEASKDSWGNMENLQRSSEYLKDREGLKDIEILDETMQADGKAYVTVRITFGNGETEETDELPLVRKNGKWIIDWED
jgi:hypothetical protein